MLFVDLDIYQVKGLSVISPYLKSWWEHIQKFS